MTGDTTMTMDKLRDAARLLPFKLRDQWYAERKAIRAQIAVSRTYTSPNGGRRIPSVFWDDPEFIARCAVRLAEFHTQAQAAVNRLAGE
jgi:hypothetical protein